MSAMIYPIILIVVSVIAVLALFLYILPGIFELVKEFDMDTIPRTTRALMAFSLFLQNNITQIIVVVIGLIIGGGVAGSTQSGKRAIFNFVLEIPLLSKMTKYYYLIKFAR